MTANEFKINKILGLLLGTALFLQALHILDENFTAAAKPEQPSTPSGGTAGAAPAGPPIGSVLATASVQRGADTAKQCELCHNLGKGQGAKIGPDLYGVVGRPVASEPGFQYSAALKAKGGTWTFDALNVWLTDPRADVPGTLMTFAGLPSEKQRADVIAYLNSNSDHPLPLPKAAQSAPAGAGGTVTASGSSPSPQPQGASAASPAPSSPAPATPAAPGTQATTPGAK